MSASVMVRLPVRAPRMGPDDFETIIQEIMGGLDQVAYILAEVRTSIMFVDINIIMQELADNPWAVMEWVYEQLTALTQAGNVIEEASAQALSLQQDVAASADPEAFAVDVQTILLYGEELAAGIGEVWETVEVILTLVGLGFIF